jgi:hypothetical protein
MMTVTGERFPTSGYDVEAEFLGSIGTGSIDGSTSLSLIFPKGRPEGTGPVEVTFVDQTTGARLKALNEAVDQTQPLIVNEPNNPVECSFAGGCSYTVSGHSVTASLLYNSDDYLTICGNPCTIDETLSTALDAVCRIPALATTYSNDLFGLVEAGPMALDWQTSASASETSKLTDGNLKIDFSPAGGSCEVKATARAEHALVVEEVGIFINNLIDKGPYSDGNLVFEGSDDEITWTTIWEYSELIHEGWNTEYVYAEPYKTIRFRGEASGSCRFGEVKIVGTEVLVSD